MIIPFAGKQDIQIWTLISRRTLPPRLDKPPLSDRAWSVIHSCWMRKASKRPRMKDITENMAFGVAKPGAGMRGMAVLHDYGVCNR